MRRKLVVPFLMGVALLVIVQAAVAGPSVPAPPVDPNWWVPSSLPGGLGSPGRITLPGGITIQPNQGTNGLGTPPPPNLSNLPKGAGGPLGDTGRIVLPGGISIQPNEGAGGVSLPPPPNPGWWTGAYKGYVSTTRISGPGGVYVDPSSPGSVKTPTIDPNWFVPSQCTIQKTACR
jgi:hypothetical protein